MRTRLDPTVLLRMRTSEPVLDGWERATVTLDRLLVRVDRRYGSWRITPDEEGKGYRELHPQVAAELEGLIKKRDRREAANVRADHAPPSTS